MRNFDAQLLRLKEVLGVTSDQEVAAALGMTKAAFSERKRRDAFPEEKLYALAARRLDLAVPVEYILTGETEMEHFKRVEGRAPGDYLELTQKVLGRAQAGLTQDEADLLELFRAAPLTLKMQAVALLSGDGSTGPKRKAVKVKGNNNRTAGGTYNEK
ncbi:MAG: hypothetical protein CVV07_01160 [Gammaproteobacteria bacterium HGW-Gammaproteobacteria-11]|nr:MAG: hypothetical protein CVV07_01160 [Gammaproteobacteria bacterium HGW-Gammaproteobacteria-11]